MTVQTARARKMGLPPAAMRSGPLSTTWWAMLILVLNEAVLFASLLAGYFYIRFNSILWPPQGLPSPELTFSSLSTLLILGSSVAIQWSLSGIRRGNAGRLRVGLAIGFLVSAVFLGIQIYEYTQLGFMPGENAYASLFWSITGLHAAHVLAGLFMNGYLQVRAAFGHFTGERHQAIENLALYWHFVGAVWVLIFASLFLSVYL